MSTIFITEKPSVAQEYRKVLNVTINGKTDGYIEGFSPVLNKKVIITWAIGHLIAICPPEKQNEKWSGNWSEDKLPMLPDVFKYEPIQLTYKQFKVVKSLYTRNDIEAIYYAGDSGREGIYIQALIRNQIFKTAPKLEEKVVWIDSYTEQSILNGIKNAKPYSEYQNMIDSGYARAKTDWLIGMNFTEGFTLTSGKLINTGRVMTPTLAMIVNRQKEIDGFTKTFYYGIKANDTIYWKADKESKYFKSDLLYNENGFIKKENAQSLIKELSEDNKLAVKDVKIQNKIEYAPYLFNLADLQAYCSKNFKISPAKALEIVQSLYEKKLTTYPRTDCRFLSSAVALDLKSKGMNVPDRYVDDSKITDHYAIIPTFYGKANSLEGLEKDVYNAIYKRFTDTMKPPYVYDTVTVTYIHKNGELFFEIYRNVKNYGFKDKDENDTKREPPSRGFVIAPVAFTLREQETKPPAAYTTGSLILAMEKAGKLIEDEELREQIKTCGIGTSATRAAIIEKLENKEFIKVDKKQRIEPTEFGKAVIPIIEKFDEALISPIKTADMEAHLNDIAIGKLSVEKYMEFIKSYVSETTEKILSKNHTNLSVYGKKEKSGAAYNCPCCGNVLKYGKYGWFCDCNFSFHSEICGHKMKEKDLQSLIKNGKTDVLKFKSKAGKEFSAQLVLNKKEKKCDFEFNNSVSDKNTKSYKQSNKSNSWGTTKWNNKSTGWGNKSR